MKTMCPAFSIIIPHKDIPDLLMRCLRSIPVSEDIQVIVVDDNSADADTYLDKCPELSRPYLEFIRTTKGGGAGYARNVGLDRAKGKWLLFADADDFFTDNLYDIITKYQNHQVDMILFKADSIESITMKPSNRHIKVNSDIDCCLKKELTERHVSLSRHSPWCRMIRRSFVLEKNIRFDEVLASNDTMFTTKVSCYANKIEVSNDILYVITYRNGSLWDSRKSPENYLTRIPIMIERYEFLKTQGYPPSPLIKDFIKMGYVDIKTNMKAFKMIYSRNVLLTDFIYIIKKIIKKLF